MIFLLCAAAALAAQPLWERRHNTFTLNSNALELELASGSTFRARRGLPGPGVRPISDSAIECKTTPETAGLKLETSDLVIQIGGDGRIAVSLPGGLRLYHETSVQVSEGKAAIELQVPATEQFYGLGPRPQASMDARGLAFRPASPFFVSSRGYAFWLRSPGVFEFDIAKTHADRVRISATGVERIEYFFAFGPSLKSIWEERHKVTGGIVDPPSETDLGLLSGPRLPRGAMRLPETGLRGAQLLCAEANALVHASLSGVAFPVFDLARYRHAELPVLRRAARLGVFAPLLQDSAGSWTPDQIALVNSASAERRRWSHFLLTYADEVRTRSYPMIHPLLHQFPRDPEAGKSVEAFMFGDEMLIVPLCDGAGKEVYLPMGVWTDWRTNRVHQGRRRVRLDASEDGVVVLAKNGSVIPLAGDPAELHYYPKLGGEFFIYEPEAGDYTQAHASPAADIYRLEIESKVSRRYQWIVHHVDKPAGVEQAGVGPLPPESWSYDPVNRSVHVTV
ncbi:MAG: hypothetical protein HY235_23435, partial [Acidobacteria bacterium]|nr:hypothetical protein [Acidobacteriota bacterium]